MKKYIVYIVCFLFLILTACSTKKEEVTSEYKLYFLNKEETKMVSENYTPEATEKEEMIKEFITALKKDPEYSDYQKALPSEVELLGYSFGEAGQLILNFSPTYNTALNNIREILTRAAIVKTFSQIEGIEYIEFTVNNKPLMLAGELPITMMKASDFIENTGNMTSFSQKAFMTIYFSNVDGTKLIETNRIVDYDSTISIEQLIIEQLIAGPVNAELGVIKTLPEGTILNDITTKDGICYVDFNEAFLNKINDVSEMVTIYSVVNSLVEQSNINKVQFLINDEKQETYQTMEFDGLFERNLDIIVGDN